jgi:UDP-2-acetamido-3-amino-2,3-dideoxy-glucuronate N-acetyltransferase
MSNAPFVHPTSVCEATDVGTGTTIWHFCHVMSGARIGRECSLGQNCFVAEGARIGDRVRIQNNVSVYSGVVLEDEVFVGPSVVFTNVSRPRVGFPKKQSFESTRIEQGASLGANATVCPGVTVGRYALVGAGAVVTRSVPAYAEVVGSPARRRGWVSRAAEPLLFDEKGEARCPVTGEVYRRVGDGNDARVFVVEQPSDDARR